MACLTMTPAEEWDGFAGEMEIMDDAPAQREEFGDEGISVMPDDMTPEVEEVATPKQRVGIRSRKDNRPLMVALQSKKGIQDETATTGVNAEKKHLPPSVRPPEIDPLLMHNVHHQVMAAYLPTDLYGQVE